MHFCVLHLILSFEFYLSNASANTPTQLTHNVFTTLLESFTELIWDKRCSNLVATFAKIYFESM